MYANSLLAVSGALFAMVAAVPVADSPHHHHHRHHQRDYVWVTKTQEVVETVDVTKTVWVGPGETPPTYGKPAGHKPPSYSSPASQPATYTPPAYSSSSSSASSSSTSTSSSTSSSSSSVYVAPTPSTSSSIYVAPVPTSTYVAPTTSAAPTTYAAPSSSTVAPAPTTYAAPPSSSVAPAPTYSAPSSSGSSGSNSLSGMAASGKTYTGDLTWYDVGLGSCGKTSSASDKIVALSHVIMSAYDNGNPNNNPLCGKYVTITGADGSKYRAEIVDTCPGCNEGSLDLSEDYFNTVTNNGDGRVHNMVWSFD